MHWTHNYDPLGHLILSSFVAAVPVVVLLGLLAFWHVRAQIAALAGLIAMGVWCARWYRRRLGGFTGDTLGAAQQLGELAAYLGALALLPLMPPMGGAHG